MIEEFTAVPPHDEDASFYSDWGDPREFRIGDIGVGECAGEVVYPIDFELVACEREAFEALRRGGVAARVMPYPATPRHPYMHAKMMVADDRRAYVGSANYSVNSTTLARELGLLFSEPDLGVAALRHLCAGLAGGRGRPHAAAEPLPGPSGPEGPNQPAPTWRR